MRGSSAVACSRRVSRLGGWFVEAVQRGEHRPVPAGDGLHSHGGVLGKSGGDRPVGGVEFAGQLGQFPVG